MLEVPRPRDGGGAAIAAPPDDGSVDDVGRFSIGIDRVCRRWRLSRDPARVAPWLEPEEDGLKNHLVEAPVRIGQ